MTLFARQIFPSFLLTGIAVLLFCYAPFSGRDQAAETLVFAAQFSTSAEGGVRLFYLPEGAASPGESAAVAAPAGPQKSARFVIPPGTYRAFRLTHPAGVEITDARIADLAGVELAHWEKERLPAAEGGTDTELRCAPPLTLRSSLTAGSGQSGALLLALTLVFALGAWRFAAPLESARVAAVAALSRGAAQARAQPVAALLIAAGAAAIVSCYPVVFSGKSFLSPNNGAPCLYAGFPTLPGASAEKIENPKMSDVGAMLWAHMPYSVVENRAIFRDHELPLRNRDNSCGVPLLGQGQSMLGDPLHWIPLAAGGASWAWDVKFIVAKILFAFGIGLLVRAAVGRLGVAVALAASSAFIGFFAYRFTHAAFFSLSYAPWILLAWLKISRAPAWRESARWVALLIVANWCELNSGTAKEASMLIAGLNFAGLLALSLGPESLPARARKLALAGTGLLLFLLVSAPCWLLFLDALRQAWTTYDVPHAYQIQPSLVLGLFDDLFYRETMPRENHANPAANFFVLIGVLWALVHARRLAADRIFLALALAALPLLALVFGVVPPALLLRLPLVGNISHVDNTFSCVLIVLLFPLAGFGLQTCRERMSAVGWRGDWLLTLLFFGALAAAYFGYIQVETRAADALIRQTGAVPKSVFFIRYATALLLAAALLPLIARHLIQARALTLTNMLLAGLAVFALHFRHGMYVATKFDAYVMNPKDRTDFQTPSPAIEYVRQHLPQPARVAGFGDVLSPGFNAVLGLESAAGPDAVQNHYYREFTEAAHLPVIWNWRVYFRKESAPLLLPFYDLLNLRYYLGMPGAAPLAVAGLPRIGASDLDLYESPTVWPRAFFTDTLVHYGTADDFAQMVWNGDRRPFAAVQDGPGRPDSLQGAGPSRPEARRIAPASGYRLTSNTTTFAVDAPAPGFAVLTEAYEEGNFRVTVNGVPSPYFRVNHAFCGVPIPQAGHFTVRFEYWPRRLTLALRLAAAGLALLAAGAAWLLASRPAPAT